MCSLRPEEYLHCILTYQLSLKPQSDEFNVCQDPHLLNSNVTLSLVDLKDFRFLLTYTSILQFSTNPRMK